MNIPEFTDNTELSRFELKEQEQIAFADYRREASRLIIDYVESPVSLRGTGTAGRLMEAVASLARQQGLKIQPVCGYAAMWLRHHKEYHDLIVIPSPR